MYCESQRITIGKKNPKTAETAGGRTPEMKVNVPGEASDQVSRKGTKVVSYKMRMRVKVSSVRPIVGDVHWKGWQEWR